MVAASSVSDSPTRKRLDARAWRALSRFRRAAGGGAGGRRAAGERRFRSGADLHYVLDRASGRPDVLLVVFSAMHARGKPAPYHYRGALRELPCHRLFIRDEHGPGGTPTWYLGRAPGLEVARAVGKLIEASARDLGVGPQSVITCGSSKGGWAALYFAARFGAGYAIAGEPQVFLGRYLVDPEHRHLAQHISGGSGEADRTYLDGLLLDALRAAETPPEIRLFCGSGSPYYRAEVVPLARYLDSLGVRFELELGDHATHVPDLGRSFPGYLLRTMNALLEGLAAPATGR